ncbi:MAG: helix-turn-helix transcriptional regulator [Chitinophagaceae bacterium]|nr:helix-turn-helix transcriptional regulator [Chitinophagaceae bacterium]
MYKEYSIANCTSPGAHFVFHSRSQQDDEFYKSSESRTVKSEVLKRVNLAKDFLHSNYAEQINLQQIAMAACMSCSHLIRKFNEVFGVTPYQYLRSLRLQMAVRLLLNTNNTIEQVAVEVGFESCSSFIRAFKEVYKSSPSIYRKQE